MATLEELATQWEDALSTSTGTTIAPGTISPVGTTMGGKKTLSWPEMVKKMRENVSLGTNEYMPKVPTGIPDGKGGYVSASNFWKAGVKSGLTPAGLATFTQPPFSGFASRTNPYVQQTSAKNQAAAVAAQTPLTPVRGNVQQPEEFWTQGDIDQAALDAYSPSTLPANITFMPSISGMLGQFGSAMMDNLSGKTQAYNDLTMATPEQMENLYNNNEFGDISTEEGRAKADNIVESWRNGQMIWDGSYTTSNVDMATGKAMTDPLDIADRDDFNKGLEPEGPIDRAINKYLTKPFEELFGDDIFMSNQEKYAGKTGYQPDGTYVDQFGNVYGGGGYQNFVDFQKSNPAQAREYALAKGRGGFFGLAPELYDAAVGGYADKVQAQLAADMETAYTNPDGSTVVGGYKAFDQQLKEAIGQVKLDAGQETFYTHYTNEDGIGRTATVSRAGYVLDGPDKGYYVGDQKFDAPLDVSATAGVEGVVGDDTASLAYDAVAALDEDASAEDVAEATYSGAGLDDVGYYMKSGGRVGMQEGGPAPQMPMPQQPQQAQAQPQGVQADIQNLGMINEQAAAMPQNGGQQSVKDDIPREADAGDYILPYETVLLTGLNQLNRYAREAVKLAMENDINLKGTDIDPTDDVPIKVSNYEYHIPKILVPFFGGGKKYLDKIREEGLALRKRLEEEKQPPMQEQQPMEQQQAPQPQMVADAQPTPQAPQMPMMAEGGFVDDPIKAIKSAEQALTSDASQPTQSAYNQIQALEQARRKSQQPPMVDPTGKVVQQGFAAPKGFKDGTPEGGVTVSDAELEDDKRILQELEPADLFALVMKSEIKDDENAEEQAKHFGSMVMNRVRDGSFGGKDLKKVLLKEGQFSGINFKKDKNHRENFKRAIRGTKVDDPYFLKYKAIANQLINRKLPDPTGGAVWVLNKKGYAKEQGVPEGSLPDYLVDVMETKQVGDLSYFNRGPKPQMKPQTPNLPAIEKAYNKGGFVEAAA